MILDDDDGVMSVVASRKYQVTAGVSGLCDYCGCFVYEGIAVTELVGLSITQSIEYFRVV